MNYRLVESNVVPGLSDHARPICASVTHVHIVQHRENNLDTSNRHNRFLLSLTSKTAIFIIVDRAKRMLLYMYHLYIVINSWKSGYYICEIDNSDWLSLDENEVDDDYWQQWLVHHAFVELWLLFIHIRRQTTALFVIVNRTRIIDYLWWRDKIIIT